MLLLLKQINIKNDEINNYNINQLNTPALINNNITFKIYYSLVSFFNSLVGLK